jgi:hypothetical protein
LASEEDQNRFNGFPGTRETVETVSEVLPARHAPLKRGNLMQVICARYSLRRRLNAGSSSAAKMAMMAMTTRSSIKVNADAPLLARCKPRFSQRVPALLLSSLLVIGLPARITKWNVSFCDGHVENLRAANLFGISNPAVAQRWNNDHRPRH